MHVSEAYSTSRGMALMRLNVNLSSVLQGLGTREPVKAEGPVGQADQWLHAEVDAAHREWQAAQQYFQMVSDPELVDHAIYNLEAAQRKYVYLFRRLRDYREGRVHREA